MVTSERPRTVGALRRAVAEGLPRHASVKDEVRANLLRQLRDRRPLFPGVIGYDETVVPHVVNALLSKHNFILLGLRGQAKTRLLRALVDLLDEAIPVVPGCEIHDDPLHPLCAACRARLATEGDALPIGWLGREDRYVEKLATPDVTIADMLGDIDPIKAARGGLQLGDELTMHYGLLPRANRGIFAINELPDLAGKIQVGLFNILQEGDVQIKGYPVRLRLDLLMAFTANPEDYTARGKIITPLKDRIGSEIRTHYATTPPSGARYHAAGGVDRARRELAVGVPQYVREVVEEVAFQARAERRIDKRSGVSQRLPITVLENVTSNAERRALTHAESPAVAQHCRRVHRAAGDDGKVRAGVRRRAARRRSDRARTDSCRRCQRVRRILRERRYPLGRGLVRQRRHGAVRRDGVVGQPAVGRRPRTRTARPHATRGSRSSR